jgi:hypothetical protein
MFLGENGNGTGPLLLTAAYTGVSTDNISAVTLVPISRRPLVNPTNFVKGPRQGNLHTGFLVV